MRIAIKKRMYKKHCGLPFHSMTAETNHYCFRHPNTEESMLQIRTLTLLHNFSQMAIRDLVSFLDASRILLQFVM